MCNIKKHIIKVGEIKLTKKVTLSMPDDLHEKMLEHKHKFNFSKIFQEVISEKIRAKEEFKARLKEAPDMEEIIERLKAEKLETINDLYENGKNDGLEFARSASYGDLIQVVNEKPMNESNEVLGNWDPTSSENELLGDVYSQAFEDYELLGMIQTRYGFIPNEFFAKWEAGFFEGVREFYYEIKDKI